MSGTKEEGEGPMGRTKEPWHVFLQTGLMMAHVGLCDNTLLSSLNFMSESQACKSHMRQVLGTQERLLGEDFAA